MVTSERYACYFRKPKKTHLNAVGGIGVPQSIFLSLAEEAAMRGTNWGKAVVGVSAMMCALLAGPGVVRGQSAGEGGGSAGAHDFSQTLDLAAVGSLLKQLQAQVQELNTQVKELKTQQQSEQAEAAELRRELDATKSRLVAMSGPGNSGAAAQVLPGSTTQTVPASTATPASTEERITKLEENQQLADQKAAE